MKRIFYLGVTLFLLTSLLPTAIISASQETPEPPTDAEQVTLDNPLYLPLVIGPNVTNPIPPSSGPRTIDHNSVALFDRIPAQYLTAARNLRLLFSDRSVGQNIHESLDCLTASSYGSSASGCRIHWTVNGQTQIYDQADYNAGLVPAWLAFSPSPTVYNRSNWVFVAKQGTWSELTEDFIFNLAPAHLDKQILSYQFSYLNITAGSGVMNFWNNNPQTCSPSISQSVCDIHDLEAFMAAHPTKTLLLWTTSLARGIGSVEGRDFNNRMRQYAGDHNMWLFDVADIEAYQSSGQPCYDNRDGVPYVSPTGPSENYPNDGLNLPAICQEYTTETDGGHLGSVAGARIRLAKAFWVLMARMAGWNGS